jgi:hypothetical protein
LFFAKTHLYDLPDADADDSVPHVFDIEAYTFDTTNYLLAVVGTCLKELKTLLDSESIADAVLLTMDPNAYFREHTEVGCFQPLI